MLGGRIEIMGIILRFTGEVAPSAEGGGGVRLVGVFPSWRARRR